VAVFNDDETEPPVAAKHTSGITSKTGCNVNVLYTLQSVEISYLVPENGHVSLSIFDTKGRFVRMLVSGTRAPGNYHVSVNARSIATGAYIVGMETNGVRLSRKIIISK
jgi:hypothetical protein